MPITQAIFALLSANVIFDLLCCVPLSATDVRYRYVIIIIIIIVVIVIIIIIIIINLTTFVFLNILLFFFYFCISSFRFGIKFIQLNS